MPTSGNTDKIVLIAEYKDETKKGMKKTEKNLDNMEKKTKSTTKSFGGMLGIIGGIGAGLAAAAIASAALWKTVGGAIEYKATLEDMETSLETLLGTSEKAEAALAWAKEFSFRTPYELNEINDALIKLSAYGLDAQDWMETLGDTAAGLGKPIMQAVEAIADAGVGEFERLKEFGLKVIQEGGKDMILFTDKFGKQQKKMIDRNNSELTTSTIKTIWNERYKGGMEKLSKNWNATMSNLRTNWMELRDAVFSDEWFNWVKEQLQKLSDYMGGLAKDIKRSNTPLVQAMDAVIDKEKELAEHRAKAEPFWNIGKGYDEYKIKHKNEEVALEAELNGLLQKRNALMVPETFEKTDFSLGGDKPTDDASFTPVDLGGGKGKKEDEEAVFDILAGQERADEMLGQMEVKRMEDMRLRAEEALAARTEWMQTEEEAISEHYQILLGMESEYHNMSEEDQRNYDAAMMGLDQARRKSRVDDIKSYSAFASSIASITKMGERAEAAAKIPGELAESYQSFARAKDFWSLGMYGQAAMAAAGGVGHLQAAKKLGEVAGGMGGGSSASSSAGAGGGGGDPDTPTPGIEEPTVEEQDGGASRTTLMMGHLVENMANSDSYVYGSTGDIARDLWAALEESLEDDSILKTGDNLVIAT